MNTAEFVAAVESKYGPGVERARAAVSATLEVLGQRLPAIDRAAVAECLPESLGKIVLEARATRAGQGEFALDEFYQRIHGRIAAASLPEAIELTQVICSLVGDLARGEAHTHLVQHLPEDIAELFSPPVHGRPPRQVNGEGRTVATGRSGSHHAVGDSPAERAHQNSVVRSSNPHGDDKISSGHSPSPTFPRKREREF